MNDISKSDEKHEERLQKVIAQAGVTSRRQAEQLITDGRVTVNGEKVTVLGTKVTINDLIKVDGNVILRTEKSYYYILNKPVSVISSAKDPQGRPTVVELLKNEPVRVFPVGRLDYETSGILVLTNDGELAHRLMHPSFGVEKTYRTWIQGPIGINALENLRQGVILDDGQTAPAKVERVHNVSKGDRLEVLEVTIHEGKNRQVRRMFAAVGYPVVKLERIRFGPLTLDKTMLPGEYREFKSEELQELRSKVGL